MPGLNQLKQFSTEILNLGDEVKVRQARGEKPSIFKIPQNISAEDDSEDFKFGMPQLSEEEQAQSDAKAAELERQANDFSDITGEEDEVESENPAPIAEAPLPDVSDLLAPAGEIDLSDIDLSDFEEEKEEEKEEEPKEIPLEDLDLDSLLAPTGNNGGEEVKEEAEEEYIPLSMREGKKDKNENLEELSSSASDIDLSVLKASPSAKKDSSKNIDLEGLSGLEELGEDESLEDADDGFSFDFDNKENSISSDSEEGLESLDSLDSDSDFDFSAETEKPVNKNINDDFSFDENPLEASPDFTDEAEDLSFDEEDENHLSPEENHETDMMGDFADFEDDNISETNSSSLDMNVSLPSFLREDISDAELISDKEAKAKLERKKKERKSESKNETPDDLFKADDLDEFAGKIPDFEMDEPSSSESETSSEDESKKSEEIPVEEFDADLDDFQKYEETVSEEKEREEEILKKEKEELPDFDTSGLDDFDANPSASTDEAADFSADDLLSEMNFDEKSGAEISPDDEVPEENSEDDGPIEAFDTSSIDGMDFSGDNSDASTDFESASFGTDDDDIFNIPGFSDTTGPADFSKKPKVETPDFEGSAEGKKVKNSFTDAEYQRFMENLSDYPLNVRIALEDLIVKNEFTDDAVFGILEKVLRKVPARTLATDLEKMLDIHLDVPRDFERRSALEYENYKKSFEYQVKNKIIPVGILSAAAAIIIYGIGLFTFNFIIQPLNSYRLFKEGYTLINEQQYPLADNKFDEAVGVKKIRKGHLKWYFRYASNYRDHKQYDRAENKYVQALKRYDHNKEAGLAWAEMEGKELFNYAEGERIYKREVLDYHINDADAILGLGDLYLDWASELDPSKYALAKEEYDQLTGLYGGSKMGDVYQSRQMRYYIRTDNLRQVLGYKEYFMSQKKMSLEGADLTELSGYLLDKRYGKLKTADEALRSSIEDVRKLLESAVRKDPSNPVSLYNFARYFVETDNSSSAKKLLEQSLALFEGQKVRNKADTYRYINAFRLMGEEYRDSREYITAEENYGKGIALFEKENEASGFESNESVGILYSDLADIDYFISGDMDNALQNYMNAVNNKNDTPSVRYRIGFIQYNRENYRDAMGSFICALDKDPEDSHLLYALGNTLSLRNNNSSSAGYYRHLLDNLDRERELHGILFPQIREDQGELVELYMKASNNLAVSQYRLASSNGNSALNGQALVNLQESNRAWDALTRNQETMVRLEGSNLAEQNFMYMTHPSSEYQPQIYTDIPRLMEGEKGLE